MFLPATLCFIGHNKGSNQLVMPRKPSLLVYYVLLRKEIQARSIHPLCRRQMASDVGSSGLFLVRIFQSYEFDMNLA